jgi:hypothetical protein
VKTIEQRLRHLTPDSPAADLLPFLEEAVTRSAEFGRRMRPAHEVDRRCRCAWLSILGQLAHLIAHLEAEETGQGRDVGALLDRVNQIEEDLDLTGVLSSRREARLAAAARADRQAQADGSRGHGR